MRFCKFVDLLREEGAENFATIWCYEPNGPGDFDAVGPDREYLWYPGDDYVDWFGIDLFQHGTFVADGQSGGGKERAGAVENRRMSERCFWPWPSREAGLLRARG